MKMGIFYLIISLSQEKYIYPFKFIRRITWIGLAEYEIKLLEE